jgi:predicted ATPase
LSFRYTQASLLSQSEAELGQWRVSLSQALGPNGQIIVNLVLELELVIAKRPPVPPDSCDPIMRAPAAWKSACRA